MGITSEPKVLLVFIGAIIIIWRGANAQQRFRNGNTRINGVRRQEYHESALMAHTIGSASMNLEYYFQTLGVACENRDPGLWRLIDKVTTLIR
jgi:hypothetical protein